MKILVNKTMIGKRVTCEHCGSVLQFEKESDYIKHDGRLMFFCAACKGQNVKWHSDSNLMAEFDKSFFREPYNRTLYYLKMSKYK